MYHIQSTFSAQKEVEHKFTASHSHCVASLNLLNSVPSQVVGLCFLVGLIGRPDVEGDECCSANSSNAAQTPLTIKGANSDHS